MASNVLPFFWHLASSSKDSRLSASADLVSTLQTFQSTYHENKPALNGDDDEEEEDEDEGDSDEESGEEVDESDDEMDEQLQQDGKKLDKQLAKDNAEDVVYTVKRLVRGLASSRESSRLGFAVALTELLTRVDTVTAPQVLSLLIRSSPHSASMKGSDVRDALFARLFGLTSIIQSGALFASSSSLQTFDKVIDNLLELGQAKGWLRESAWWGILGAAEGVLSSQTSWKDEAMDHLAEKVYADKAWSQEKIALTLVLEEQRPNLPWKTLLLPTFKHTPLLHPQNLHVVARLLKDSDFTDEEEGSKLSVSTGSWKPQLHFVWDKIFDAYFSAPSPVAGRAPFQDFFRAVVDESLFSNASSAERKFWGFSVLSRALPIMPSSRLPLLFTPNVMRIWTSELASTERYLHKAAMNLAKDVQTAVKTNPTAGFALLSALVKGKGDFDKVTKTKTVESIMNSLNEEGVRDYITYLREIILGGEQNGSDSTGLEDRRQWALTQIHGLFRNHKVPMSDAVISDTLDFLLVHGLFIVRAVDKKSKIAALRAAPKPALSEATAAACRSKFFTCLVELVTAPVVSSKEKDSKPRQQGCDASGRLWLRRVLDTLAQLEGDSKHAELVLDADEEIKKLRKEASSTFAQLDKKAKKDADVARGVEILLSYSLLQTYDESEDALEMLEEVNGAAQGMFKIGSKAAERDEHPPIDTLLDVLIALLEKGSSGLKDLGKLVVGMVGSAFTLSTIEHLVAQLEQTAPEAIEVDEDAEGAEVNDDNDESEASDDDDDEDESEDDEEASDDDEDDANLEVDPEFRRRVAEALAGAGVNVDEDAESGSDDDSEEEVWDDEQMMKVDEQLAEVFRQRANAGKSSDFKHLHIESVHFKTRILDFFEVFAKKQATNPIILHIIVPLLRLVANASPTEKDLSNKATSILRTRLPQSKAVPSTADEKTCSTILDEIHAFARRAPTIEFSQVCSSCSIFVFRTLEASAPASTAGVDAYRATLTDYMSRKTSSVHPVFINDLLKRYPVRAFPLADDLLRHGSGEDVKKVYNQAQAFSMLTFFSQQLNTLSKALTRDELVDFTRKLVDTSYTLLEKAPEAGSEWDATRIREVIRFALHLARSSKATLGEEIIVEAWDVQRLEKIAAAVQTGARTANMKGVQNDLKQLSAVLVSKADRESAKKSKKQKRKAEVAVGNDAEGDADADKMDVDGEEEAEKPAKAKGKKAKVVNGDAAAAEAPAKKRKVKAEKAETKGEKRGEKKKAVKSQKAE